MAEKGGLERCGALLKEYEVCCFLLSVRKNWLLFSLKEVGVSCCQKIKIIFCCSLFKGSEGKILLLSKKDECVLLISVEGNMFSG